LICKNIPPRKQTVPKKPGKKYGSPPKPQRACGVLNFSDTVNTAELVTGGMTFAEVGLCYGKNEIFEIKNMK
jgi:hypothetical protein